jgi:hypothetical protein
MKSRPFVFLIAALVVLVAIYLVQQQSTEKKTISESLIQLCPDFNMSSVKYISVYKQDYPDSGLHFVKKDGTWLVASYFDAPAKENDIETLLSDVKSLQGEIRSTKPELFGDYDISDSLALHMIFSGPDSSEIAHFLVGKGVPQASRSSFMRNAGADTVYKADQNFLSRFAVWNAEPWKKMPGKRWAEMAITNTDRNIIQSIEIKDKKKTYLFARKLKEVEDTTAMPEYVWEQTAPTRGKILEDKDIQTILGRLSRLNAKEIIGREAKPEYGLARPEYVAGFTTEDGTQTRINFGAEIDTTSSSRYATVEGKPYVYDIAKYNFESLFVTPFNAE